MRQAITALFLAFVLLALPVSESAQQQPQQPQPPPPDQQPQQSGQSLIVRVNLVDLLATVLNRRNKLVPDLEPFYGAECPVAIVYRASWPDERVIRATLGTIVAEIAKNPIERTALILVGKVLGARAFRESALYDAGYQRRFRGRDT